MYNTCKIFRNKTSTPETLSFSFSFSVPLNHVNRSLATRAMAQRRTMQHRWGLKCTSGGWRHVSNTGLDVKFGGSFFGATSFPQVITYVASFNASLWEAIGPQHLNLGPKDVCFPAHQQLAL